MSRKWVLMTAAGLCFALGCSSSSPYRPAFFHKKKDALGPELSAPTDGPYLGGGVPNYDAPPPGLPVYQPGTAPPLPPGATVVPPGGATPTPAAPIPSFPPPAPTQPNTVPQGPMPRTQPATGTSRPGT